MIYPVVVYLYNSSLELFEIGKKPHICAGTHIGVPDIEVDAPTLNTVTNVFEVFDAPCLKSYRYPGLFGAPNQVLSICFSSSLSLPRQNDIPALIGSARGCVALANWIVYIVLPMLAPFVNEDVNVMPGEWSVHGDVVHRRENEAGRPQRLDGVADC